MIIIIVYIISSTIIVEADNAVFIDIDKSKWYYSYIVNMYNFGVISGYGDGRFGPDDDVTYAQAISMITKLANIDTDQYDTHEVWYSGIENWHKINIDNYISNYDMPISRYKVCEEVVKIYKLDISDYIDNQYNPFLDTGNVYVEYLYTLGIVSGYGDRNFYGDNSITRAEFCAILNNMVNLNKPYYEDLYIPINYDYFKVSNLPEYCDTIDDIVSIWEFMLVNTVEHVEIKSSKPDLMDDFKNKTILGYSIAASRYAEFASFYNKVGYGVVKSTDPNSNIDVYKYSFKLGNYAGISSSLIKSQTNEFMQLGYNEIAKLYKKGLLSNNMSVKDKAFAIYRHVIISLAFDTEYKNRNVYETLINRTGVCSGYNGIYNYLCHLIGIPLISTTGKVFNGESWEDHIWAVYIDGFNQYHIDPTWGDPVPDRANYSDSRWFWKTFDMFKNHKIGENSQIILSR